MTRLLIPLALVALAALTWFMLQGGEPSKPRGGADAGTAESTRPEPLPALVFKPEPMPSRPEMPPERVVEYTGPLGHPVEVLDQRMNNGVDWRPVPNMPYAWDQMNGTRLVFKVVGNRIVGASAYFKPDAASAHLTGLSAWLVGNQEAMPVHWEAYTREDAEAPREGSFETTRGVTLYYRGMLRQSGEPPYGPERFELSTEPFPTTP